jgi:cobalt-precorrin 5A hydrolase/precorrin-3B C17-methyltransferase
VEFIMSNPGPAIIVLNDAGVPLARQIADAINGEVHGLARRVTPVPGIVVFDDVGAHLRAEFARRRPIIAIMAVGAVIRLVAPLLVNKQDEPAVLCVSEDGRSIVPLLGGHHGANDLAREIAERLDGHAAVTTAGDVRFGIALDAPPAGYTLANPNEGKPAMAALLSGGAARIEGVAGHWLTHSALPQAPDGSVVLTVSEHTVPAPAALQLVYHPATLALGVGCERGCDAAEVIALADATLAANGLSSRAVGVVVSLDLKADETAVHAVAGHFGVPARFFDAETLERETPRLATPSDVVFAEVGCHGVAEGAALAAVGTEGRLLVAKQKSARATIAIGQALVPFTEANRPGRGRGQLFVVGIGPGKNGWRSPEVTQMIGLASDLVGYSLYLDLLGGLAACKQRHDFDLGAEELRVRHAMELAGEGRDVALVCSGDAGIYAMATLVFELLDCGGLSDAAHRIGIAVSPGISALQAAAAHAGAPLGHDFCTISLSDLLTPLPDIERRVRAAGEGDFVIAFYNPVSRKRRTQLANARDELLRHRPADTPVILATNLGRDGEHVRIVPLGALDIDEVDMLTVVIVGSSNSRVIQTGDGRDWVYTPRGYSAKPGTRLIHQDAAE